MVLALGLAVISCLLLAPLYVGYKPPAILIRYFQHRWPDVLFHVPTNQKIVALTIDDAPSEYTKEILEILEANDVTATFFVIGSQVRGHEQTLENAILKRNELGNHAMHDEPSRSLSDSELMQQIETVQSKLADAYASVNVSEPGTLYFRPGSGFFSTRMRKLVLKLNYKIVIGNIFPFDPQIPYWRINANHILSMLQPGGIIICHDRRPWTAPMLRKVLPEIKRRGYRVVTITELLRETKP